MVQSFTIDLVICRVHPEVTLVVEEDLVAAAEEAVAVDHTVVEEDHMVNVHVISCHAAQKGMLLCMEPTATKSYMS